MNLRMTWLALALACGETIEPGPDGPGEDTGPPPGTDTGTETTPPVDADADGFTVAEGDCDDGDPAVNPGAVEACDGLDNDCDDRVDDAFAASLVETDGTARGFPTLNAAVTHAIGGGVREIDVCPGDDPQFVTPIDVANLANLGLRGVAGAEPPVLQIVGDAPLITVREGAELVVEGLTLVGGGIVLDGGSSVEVVGSRIQDAAGPGLQARMEAARQARVVVRDSEITGCQGGATGGGLEIRGNVALTVTGSRIAGNHADDGAGLYVRALSGRIPTVDLVDTTIENNQADRGGGAFVVQAVVQGGGTTTFASNRGFTGSGVVLVRAFLHDVVVTGHEAGNGGGIAVLNPVGLVPPAECGLDGVTVRGNRANQGGGIWIEAGETLRLTGGAVITNPYGDGVFLPDEATLIADGVDFGVGATDNLPQDVHTESMGSFPLNGVVSVQCTGAGGCEPL